MYFSGYCRKTTVLAIKTIKASLTSGAKNGGHKVKSGEEEGQKYTANEHTQKITSEQ